MEESLLRSRMMELWKETFHDTDRYIKLVFDAYFKPQNVFVRFVDETLAAMMLCIPYTFKMKKGEGCYELIDGIYLCGLATRPEFRRQGIMSQLMGEAEEEMAARGYALSFLIPADEHLRAYYARMGYYTATMRRTQNIRFSQLKPDLKILPLRSFKMTFPQFPKSLAQECSRMEAAGDWPSIIHSAEDMLTVFDENENTFFLADDSFDADNPDPSKVKAIVLPDKPVGTEEDNVIVTGIYDFSKSISDNRKDTGKIPEDIMKGLSGAYPNSRVKIIRTCPEADDRKRCRPYAMVKILRSRGERPLFENMMFDISQMLD